MQPQHDPGARELVRVGRAGPVLLVTLDRAEKRNAVNGEVTAALDAAFEKLDADADLRVAVLAAQGPVFCAGSDLVEGPGSPTLRGGEYGFIRRARTKPVIAALEGPAMGGGFEIVLACDLVVASRSVTFSLPESTRGRVANAGGLFRGATRLPRNVVTELLLTGGRLGAQRAFDLGLVNRLVNPGEVLGAALELALDTCEGAPTATAEVLSAIRALDVDRESAGWAATAAAGRALANAPDRQEGSAAFFERRPPRWRPDRAVIKHWSQA